MKRALSVAVVFFVFLVLTRVAAAQTSWLDPAWKYRLPVTVSGPCESDATNYQVKVSLDSDFAFDKAQTGGSDLRITEGDGVTPLPFWIETWDSTAQRASIWVKVPTLPLAGTSVYLYYGNSLAASASSGADTFTVYDGFETNSVGSIPVAPVPDPGYWSKYAGNPVIPNNGFGSTFYDGSIYHNFVNYGTINHYTSPDGINWTADPANPVLTPTQTWEGGNVGVPMAWKEGSTWYMLYRGGSPNVIGLATSTDAVNWTKSEANPVLVGDSGAWDDTALDPWGVIKVDDTYYMWYNTIGGAPGQNGRCSGLATSTNLTDWTKDPLNPLFCGGRFCPFPFKYGDYYYLLVPHYTSGSDYSQHELYRDASPTFHPADREYLGVAIQFGPSEWDDHDQDTPAVLTDTIYRDTYNASNNQLWVYYAGEGGDGNWQTGMIIEENIAAAIAGVNSATFSWSAPGGAITVVDDPVRQGVRSVRQHAPTGSVILAGNFPSQTSGAVSAWMRRSSTSVGDYDIYLYGEQLSCVAGLGRDGDFHYWTGAFQPTGIPWAPNTWYLVTIAFDAATQRYDFTVQNEALAELVRVEDIAFGRVSTMINSAQLYTSGGFIEDGFADDFRLRPWCGADASTTVGTEEPFNTAPIADDQSVSTNEDSAVAIILTGSDADDDPLVYTVLSGPSHGTLSGAEPNLTYTPDANCYGADSFTFSASDGTVDSNTATVTITVNSVNDAPVADADSYGTSEDTLLEVAAPGVLSNDSDVDGGSLTAVLVTGPSHGTLNLNSNGSFTYTPAANYSGADSFTYRASDGSLQSDAATVNLTVTAVNDAPVAASDAYSTDQITTLTVPVPGVLGNDTDADGDPLTAVLVSGPSHGTLDLNSNGSFTYTPAANYSGADSFTYRASDGSLQSDAATVALTVNYTDVLPDIAVIKTGLPTSVPETGGNVTFTYVVTNNSTEAATITVLSDDQFGTLSGDSDCQVGTVLASGASCSFEATFAIPAGDVPGSHINTFSATVTDGDGNTDTATALETINYIEVPLEVVRVTSPEGGDVLTSGRTHVIKWITTQTENPVASVRLFYSEDAGMSWKPIRRTIRGNPGWFSWRVPWVSETKTYCKVKVELRDRNGVILGSGESAGNFTIQPRRTHRRLEE
jgi:VCBS repeat-containing protein